MERVEGEVVRVVEPAALVVGRIVAGRWVVVEMMAPWALVGRKTETEALESLVETEVVSVGEASGGFVAVREGISARGALDMPVSAGAFAKVGPSSDSVDVEVFVRYDAVSNANAALVTSSGSPTSAYVGLQFQTPISGKRLWIKPTVPPQSAPHILSHTAVKVQPLGSSTVLTPVA